MIRKKDRLSSSASLQPFNMRAQVNWLISALSFSVYTSAGQILSDRSRWSSIIYLSPFSVGTEELFEPELVSLSDGAVSEGSRLNHVLYGSF